MPKSTPFTGSARVKLEEENDNDTRTRQIGAIRELSADPTPKEQFDFKTSGAWYEFSYQVAG